MEKEQNNSLRLNYYGGALGAWIPLILMVTGIVVMAVLGMVSIKRFLAIGYISLVLAFFLLKEKKELGNLVIKGIQNPLVAIIIPCFLFAGILSQVLSRSGLVSGLMWLCTSINIQPGLLPVLVFLISGIIAICTGTSNGTVAAVTPIMFPLAMAMGCDPGLVLGAIISGGALGDNLSPISDTTVTVSSFLNLPVGPLVKDRVKYTAVAGAVASAAFLIAGMLQSGGNAVAPVEMDAAHAKTLVMLLIPVLMVIMLARNMELVPTLMLCSGAGLVLAIAFGLIPLMEIFAVEGPVISGCVGMMALILFVCFICIFLEIARSNGSYEQLTAMIIRKCSTKKHAELVTFFMAMLGVLMTASNTLAIILVSPLGKEIYDGYQLDRNRCGNLISGVACAAAGIVPFCTAFVLNFTLASETGLLPSGFSLFNISAHSFFCIALLLLYLVCCAAGLWRKDAVAVSAEE